MGQFSWLDCVDDTQIVDDKYTDVYVLIPYSFGGGHILEKCYDGYGNFGGFDIYDLVAMWNREFISRNPDHVMPSSGKMLCDFDWYPYFADMSLSVSEAIKKWKESENTYWGGIELRIIGIDLACYDEDNYSLRFPIKITHRENAVYEKCKPSETDPDQGWESDDGDGYYLSELY
jgi:hypothetical protein